MSNPWKAGELEEGRKTLREKGIVRGDDVVCKQGSGVYLGLIWLDREGTLAVVDIGSDELCMCHYSSLTLDV